MSICKNLMPCVTKQIICAIFVSTPKARLPMRTDSHSYQTSFCCIFHFMVSGTTSLGEENWEVGITDPQWIEREEETIRLWIFNKS